MLKNIITLIRLYQYTKNLFIFTPLFFHFVNTKDFSILTFSGVGGRSIFAFILFSLLASGIYIFNDLQDLEADKNHPTKKFRPLASGAISKKTAISLMILLWSISFSISYILNINLFIVFIAYFFLNIAYSFRLKHIAIVDIFIIAIGFVLRLFAGSTICNIELSHWIIIMTFLLALFLAMAKRRDDVLLANQGMQTRKNIGGYNLEFINSSMVFMSGVILLAYILYATETNMPKYLYLNSLFVVFGIIRYMQLTFVENASGDPVKIVLNDRRISVCILLWVWSFVFLI